MLKQKFLLDFGSQFITYFIGAIVGIMVARIAGPEVVGTLAYGLSFVSIFGFLHSLFGTSHVKLLSEGKDLAKCTTIYSALMIVSVIVFILAVLIYYLVKTNIYDENFNKTEQIVIVLSLGVVSINALLKVGEVTFIGLTERAKVNAPKIITILFYQPARIIVVLLGFGAIALATVNFLSTIFLIPVYIYLTRNMSFKGNWDHTLLKRYLSIGLPVFIFSITNSVMIHYGKIMLKETSSVVELGYFAAGVSIANIMLMLGQTSGQIFMPTFSKAYINNDISNIKSQLNKYEQIITLFGLPIFVILSLFSDPIIPLLMGEQYISSVPIFSLLAFSSFLLILVIPYPQLINGMNKFGVTAKLNLLFVLLYIIILYIFLGQRFLNLGGIGLAWSMLILSLVKFIVYYIYNKQVLKINLNWRTIKIIIFNMIVYFLFILIKNEYFLDISIISNFLLAFILLILIYSSLYFMKLLNRNDVDYLISIFDFKALLNYSKTELKK